MARRKKMSYEDFEIADLEENVRSEIENLAEDLCNNIAREYGSFTKKKAHAFVKRIVAEVGKYGF